MPRLPTKRRRWFRPRNIALFFATAFIAPALWVTLQVWPVYVAEPVISVNYRERFRERAAEFAGVQNYSASEDAWRLLMEVLEAANAAQSEARDDPFGEDFQPREDSDSGYVDFNRVYSGTDPSKDIGREQRALSLMHERSVFTRLTELESLPPALRQVDANDESIMFESKPYLSRARLLAKALRASMRLAAQGGRIDEATLHGRHMLMIAQAVSLQPTLIDYLVGAAIETLALAELRLLIMEHNVPEPACQAMLDAMSRYRLPEPAFAVEGERLSFHDLIQRTFSDDGSGDGFVCPYAMVNLTSPDAPSKVGLSEAFHARFRMAGRRQTIAAYDTFVDAVLPNLQRPVGSQRAPSFTTDEYIADLPKNLAMVKSMLPGFESLHDTAAMDEVLWQGTRVMIYLELYHARTGTWPTSLDALTPEILEQVPLDPLHGKPWGYLRVDDDEGPYLLYSIGLDGEDNGGRWTPEVGRRPIVNQDFAGWDAVINTPRE